MNTTQKITDAMNIKSVTVKENTFKELFSIYDLDKSEPCKSKLIFGSREQAEVYSCIMFGENVTVLNAPIFDKSRIDYIDKIELDKLEFNVSINFEGSFMCRYNEVVLFDFDIIGESVLIKFEKNANLSIPLNDLKEFPDFIVLLDTI